MRTSFYLLFFLPAILYFFVKQEICAQITFQYTIGGEGDEQALDLIRLPDGGYAITGFTSSYSSGIEDIYLLKLNNSFDLEWSRVFGSHNNDRGHKLIASQSGGFLITGTTYTNGNNNPPDMMLARTDDDGELIWIFSNGGSQSEVGWGLVELPDSNIIFTGASRSYAVTGNGAYLFKTDQTGSPLWGHIFDNTSPMGAPASDNSRDIILCSSGDYVYITGMAKRPGICPIDNNASNVYLLLAKTDLNGELIWHTYVGGNTCRDNGFGLIQTSDGNIVATGFTQNYGAGGDDVYLVKVDANTGNLIWTRTYGQSGNERANHLSETADGGLVLTGWTDSYGSGSTNVLLLKTNEQGHMEWSRVYGGSGTEEGFAVVQTDDLGYLIVGYTNSFGNGGEDILIIKTDENGHIEDCGYGSPEMIQGSGGITQTGLSTSTGYSVAGISADNEPGANFFMEVDCCPQAIFEVGEICPETPVQFTDLSEGDIVSWHWDFGEGSESSEINPVHLFSEPGIYTVTLIVSNDFNCADTTTQEVEIPEKIELYIDGDSIICAENSTILTAGPGDLSYLWNTGESGQMITVSPEEDTEYYVWQANAGSCVPDTAYFLVEVIEAVPAGFTGNTLVCSGQNTELTAHPENATYQWSTGDTTQSIVINPEFDTPFYVIISDNRQCNIDTIQIFVEVIQPINSGFIGDTLLCEGEPTILTAQPDFVNYQWSTGEFTQSILLTPEVDTSLYVIVSDGTQCNTDTIYISIEVIEKLTASFSGDTLLCSGQSTQLWVHPANAEYQWSTGETTQSITISPDKDTLLYVIVTDNNQCVADTLLIEVTLNEGIIPGFTGDTLLCYGQSTLLTALPPGVDYLWSTGEMTQTIQFSPEKDTSLFVVFSDSTQCDYDTVFISLEVIHQLETGITGDSLLCRGQSTHLTAHPENALFLWNTGETTQSILISPENDTSFFAIVSDSSQCFSDTLVHNIEVIQPLEPGFTGDTILCQGQTTLLTAQPDHVNYEWSTGEISQSILLTPQVDTSLYLIVSDGTHCNSDTVYISLEVIEKINTAFSGDTLLCYGQSTELVAHPANAEYQWSTGETTQSILLSPENDTSIFTIVSDSSQCFSDTLLININVIQPLNPGFTGDTLLCQGQTTQLTASPENVFYQWSTGETEESISLSPELDTSIFVIVSDGSPCNHDTIYISLEVIELITAGWTGDSLLCSGQNTILTAYPENAIYQWSTGEFSQSVLLSPEVDTSVFVIVSDGTHCNNDTLVISLEVIDPIIAGFSGDTLLCSGQNTLLTAQPENARYQWSTGEISRMVDFLPEADTSIFLIVADSMECSTDTIFINLHILLDDFAEIRGNLQLCLGEQTQLTAYPPNLSYEWSTGDTLNSISITPNTDSRIRVKIFQGGCTDSTEVSISVWEYADLNITPGNTVICPDEELNLRVRSSNCTEFLWSPNAYIDCATCDNPLVFPEVPTTYYVICETDSLCFSMDSVRISIETNVEQSCYTCETTAVYIPNSFSPNEDGINDVFFISGTGIESVLHFSIYSKWGEQVFRIENVPANSPEYGWDGNYNNQMAAGGTYIYLADILCEKKGTTQRKGTITILR